MKLYGKCEQCHKNGFFVRKRQILMPQIGTPLTSQKELCNSCYNGILFMLTQNKSEVDTLTGNN